MLEAFRLQVPNSILLFDLNNAAFCGDFADARYRDAVYSLRQARHVFRRDREQQFKVLTTMQSQREWIECAPTTKLLHIIVERKRCGINDRTDVTLFAQVMQIRR